VGDPPDGIPTGKKGKAITEVLTLCTCFRDFQGGNETRSVTEELLGTAEHFELRAFLSNESEPNQR
jgi:hypothetical protein